MILLELKKVHKKKYILFTVFFTFFYSEQSLDAVSTMFINAPTKSYVSTYFSDVDFNIPSSSHLSSKNIEDIMSKKDEIRLQFYKKLGDFLFEQDDTKKNSGLRHLYYSYFDDLEQLRNSYNINLSKENKLNWNWILFESKYNIENNTPAIGIESYYLSKNPIRLTIRGFEVIFGILPIIFLILIFSSSISEEKINGNLNLLKVAPISKFKIIFYKWLSMVEWSFRII